MRSAFDPLLDRVRDNVEVVKHLHLDARKPPWTAIGVEVSEGQEISAFATGRPWRSRSRDLWLAPRFGLWCRLGENGIVFNSARDTNTFKAERSAELYLLMQFPGQFADPTGRVQPPERIVRVWLIAECRWQRFRGDMSVKDIKLASSRGVTDVT